jgi:UV DNA damage endonuclease
VYDVLHHRCLPDGLSIRKVTSLALKTWDREPLFHISSPKYGWGKSQNCWHSDYIDKKDFPEEWKALDITVEVEAKAKELAVKRLYMVLQDNRVKTKGKRGQDE